MTSINDYLEQYIGQQIPGGCEHCDAYQTVERDPLAADLGFVAYCNLVHHDDDCPWWLRYQNRQARREAVKRAKRRRQ